MYRVANLDNSIQRELRNDLINSLREPLDWRSEPPALQLCNQILWRPLGRFFVGNGRNSFTTVFFPDLTKGL